MDWKKHGKIFLNGLVVVTPLIITVIVVTTAVRSLDNAVQKGLDTFFHFHAPGAGFLLAILGIYVVGLLARSWLLKWPIQIAEAAVQQIPLIKSLYSALKDLLHFVGGADAKSRGKPCVVRFGEGMPQALGLITTETPRRLPPDDPVDRVAVFMPMSYQLGGFTLYLPPDKVRVIEGMSVEELLKLCLTAGVGTSTPVTGEQQPMPDGAVEHEHPPSSAEEELRRTGKPDHEKEEKT